MRKTYVRIKLPGELMNYVTYVVQRRLLGYRSLIEFVSAATRKEVQRLCKIGVIPPEVPEVTNVPNSAIGTLAVVLLVALVGLGILIPSGPTGMGILDDVFNPLADWNVGHAYERYQGFINITLYFVAFLAIFFSVTKRWLDRREAIILSVAFSAAMSLGLAMMPANWIRQLPPIALLTIVLVLFYLVLEVLRKLGFAWISSGSIAYVFAYLLVKTHNPDLFRAAGMFGSILNLAFLVAFMIALWKIFAEAFKRSEGGFVKLKHAAKLAWGDSFGNPEEREALEKEQEELGRLLTIEPLDYKSLRNVERDLEKAEEAIRKYGYSRQALDGVAQELSKLRDQESELTKELEDLKVLAERVQAVDIDLFGRLKKGFNKLTSRQRLKVHKLMKEKVTELKLETVLPRLVGSAQQAQRQVMESLNRAINELERNQPHDAIRWLDRTRYYVAQLRQVLTQVKDTEKAIKALLNRTMRYFKK